MTMFLAPYTAIADIDGSPLDAGFLFFGEYGKDPELFPVPVYWDADFTVPAAQPIRTRNGYPVRNGSPTKVYLKTAQHSIVIKNRNSAFILVDFKNKGWDASFVVDGDKTQKQINDELHIFSTPKMFGAKGDGITDDTLALQEMFDQKGLIVIPDGTYLVSESGTATVNNHHKALLVKSGSIVYFSEGAKIKLAPNSRDRCMTLFIDRQFNVELHGPNIEGDRFEHLGTTGEHGHAIGIFGGENITLNNPTLKKAWGDGIYISSHYNLEPGIVPKNITVNGGTIEKNSRNGISISGVDGCFINGTTLIDNDRTAPKSGIDIEPRGTIDAVCKNIFISNCVSRGGDGGFFVLFNNTINPENSANITDCNVEGVTGPAFVFGTRNKDDVITMTRITAKNCGGPALDSPHVGSAGSVSIKGIKAISCNLTDLAQAISVGNTNTRDYVMSNVHISGIEIDSPSSSHAVLLREMSGNVTNHGATKNVVISIDSIKSNTIPYFIYNDVACRLINNSAQEFRMVGGDASDAVNIRSADGYYQTYKNSPNRRNSFSLPRIYNSFGLEFTFEASDFGDIIVAPNSADKINFKNLTVGQYIRSRDKQARITLRATEAGWVVSAMVGEWTMETEPSMNTASKVYDPPSISANGSVITTVALGGAKVGDVVQAAFTQYNADIDISAVVSAADTVTVKFKSNSAAPIDLPSGTLTVKLS